MPQHNNVKTWARENITLNESTLECGGLVSTGENEKSNENPYLTINNFAQMTNNSP